MKPRTLLALLGATLLLGAPTAAQAQSHPCTTAHVSGAWGYTKTGTLVLPTGAVPFASVGRFVLDNEGNMAGMNDGVVGGKPSRDVLIGFLALDRDCTGTMTVEVHDTDGVLLRTLTMGIVFVDDLNEMRGIVTSLVLPNGATVPATITSEARAMSPRRDR